MFEGNSFQGLVVIEKNLSPMQDEKRKMNEEGVIVATC